MHVQRVAVGLRSPQQPRRELEEHRLAQLEQVRRVGRQADDMGHRKTDEERRNGDDEAGNGTGDADIEQHPLARNRLADADERTHRAGQQERDRDEKRQRRVDVIIAAREIVAELVAPQDRQDGGTVPEPAEEQDRERHREAASAAEVPEKAGVVSGAHQRCGRDRQRE